MTDHERPAGWDAVPHAEDLRGEQQAAHTQQAAPQHPAQQAAPQQAAPQQPAPQQPAQHTAHPQQAAQQTAPQPDPYATYHPTRRATRRRLGRKAVVGIVAGATALLLLVGGTVAYSRGSEAHAPTHQVDAFLDDLEAGHVTRALAAAGIERKKGDVLLTDAAYAEATGRITGHTVVHVDTTADSATVDVYLRQRGRSVPATFQLTRSGTDAGVFPVWELDPVSLGSVEVAVQGPAGTPVEVAGERVTDTDGAVTLRALPGTYAVGLEDGAWFDADATSTEVKGFGSTATARASLTAALTTKGAKAAQQAVDSWVDTCVAAQTFDPPGCSFHATGQDPAYTYTNEKWTLESRPTFSVGGWTDRGWAVATTIPGSVTFTADISGPAGTGTGSAGPVAVAVDGFITGFTEGGATYATAVVPEGGSTSGA